MNTIKKYDFVEIEYVGRIKGTDQIFDLTDEELAKKNNIYNKNLKYGPIVICVGENHIIKGLDKNILGKTTGKYKIEIKQEDGFGKKNPRLIKIVNSNIFLKQNINPFPGLQVNIDGIIGTIRSVSGGRCIVDFNHPLSGKDLEYEINIIRSIDDIKQKINSLLNFTLFLRDDDFEIDIKDNNINIKLNISHKPDNDILNNFIKKTKEIIPNIGDINFI